MENIETILRELDRCGYFLGHNWTMDRLVSTMDMIGQIKQTDEIAPQIGSTLYIRSKKSIPFHNEDPDVVWLAWFCERPASDGGQTFLVDGSEVVDVLKPRTRIALSEIVCGHRNPSGQPILSSKGEWYLIPWAIPKRLELATQEAVDDLLSTINRHNRITLNLKEDDVLIVQNRRMFHGRNSFTDESRKLIRIISIRR